MNTELRMMSSQGNDLGERRAENDPSDLKAGDGLSGRLLRYECD